MRIVDMPRGTGKTYQLAQVSEEKNIPIIIADNLTKKLLLKKYPNAHFMSWQEYSHLSCYGKPIDILIDEFPSVLKEIFKDSVILAATYSSEDQYNDEPFLVQAYKSEVDKKKQYLQR